MRSDETRNKISKSRKGKAIGNHNAKGSKRTEEWKKNKSEEMMGNQHTLGYKHSKETIQKMRESHIGKVTSEETKQKQRKSATGRKHSEESKQKMRESHIGKKHTEERNRENIAIQKKLWADPIWHKEQQNRMASGNRLQRPNKPETQLMKLLESIQPGDWKYVGDGDLIIAGKNPDFVNVNGKKLIIEMWGDYWHRNDNPEDRIDVFKPFGYRTLVIWQRELKNIDRLVQRIQRFTK